MTFGADSLLSGIDFGLQLARGGQIYRQPLALRVIEG